MDQYIKMVLALPAEFFTGWEWQAGDRAITKFNREMMIVSTELKRELIKKTSHVSGEWIEAIYPYSDDITHEFFKIGDSRPLPSQKQLQSMLNLNPIEFIEDLYAYSQEPLLPGMDNEQFKTDLECFTLAYVMDRKFGKYWDGEKWVSRGDQNRGVC